MVWMVCLCKKEIYHEITTGRTILNIAEILKQAYGKKAFAAVSLLNGMDPEAQIRFEEKNIGLEYLVKTDHRPYAEQAERFAGDGMDFAPFFSQREYPVIAAEGYIDARRLTKGGRYRDACMELWKETRKHVPDGKHRILVLGTEEFMYPALYAALEIEKMGHDVRFHATTRSPIRPSREADYPLHARYELRSVYDAGRTTYLYELEAYDEVFVITDAPLEERGLESLLGALEEAGNKKIQIVRWCGA